MSHPEATRGHKTTTFIFLLIYENVSKSQKRLQGLKCEFNKNVQNAVKDANI